MELNETRTAYVPRVNFHPGVTLGEKLDEMGLTAEAFAGRVGLDPLVVHGIVDGEIAVTSELATALEAGTGIPVRFWLQKQSNVSLPPKRHPWSAAVL